MQVDYNKRTIKCFICNEDKDMTRIYVDYPFEQAISCDKDHIIGYTWDNTWKLLTAPCNYHYIYHGRGQCRCVQEETNCFGIDEDCENLLGRKSYMQDIKENKIG